MSAVRGRTGLVLLRHRNHTGMDSRALKRAAERGDLVRLRNGAYVEASTWSSLGPDERIRLEVAAADEVHRGAFIASHRSAAALWGVPRLGPHDGLVHQRVTVAAGSRTEHGVRKHAVDDVDLHLAEIDGIAVTNLHRTILDLAATEPFAAAVTAADWALREHTTKERLRTALDEWAPTRVRPRIERVIAFADGAAQGAGESVSRVQIAEAGLATPELQRRFDDHLGLIGYVDFFWPEVGLIGEFDGFVKYRKPEFMAGRTDSAVVIDEKLREDRLRASAGGPRVTRWVWSTLQPVGRLAAQLRRAGVR